MKKAITIARETGWIDAAEAVIGGTITGQPWTLEDPDDEEIPETTGGEVGRAHALLAKPYANVEIGRKWTSSELWKPHPPSHRAVRQRLLVPRPDGRLWDPGCPTYIYPWRMDPNEDKAGNLLSWQVDRGPEPAGSRDPAGPDRPLHAPSSGRGPLRAGPGRVGDH